MVTKASVVPGDTLGAYTVPILIKTQVAQVPASPPALRVIEGGKQQAEGIAETKTINTANGRVHPRVKLKNVHEVFQQI